MRIPSLCHVAAFFFAAVLTGFAQGNQLLYDDSLENGWQDWGWAIHNYSNPSPVHGGSDSVSVTCSNYTALYMEHAAFNATPYTNLAFWADGGASGGQMLSVAATLGGTAQGWFKLAGPLPANAWTNIAVPLSVLGVAGAGNLDGIWISIQNPNLNPTFYLDDISLQAAPPAGPNPTNVITVDAGRNRHPISPLIYGAAFATSNELSDLNFTMNRSGGNEESTYNWTINAHGKGADWYFESYPDGSATPGESADSVVADSKAARAQPLITIPMMSWGPKLGPGRAKLPSYSIKKYGPQKTNDPYFTDAGNGVSVTNNTPITWNDPNDSYIPVDTNFQKSYVQHLTNVWGVSTNGGVGYYIMDNEHSLWFSTHQDIHPVGPTMREIFAKIVAYASMVKSVDPQALVLGPEEWGWNGYLYSGYDQQWSAKHGDYPDRKTNGGWDYMPWLLHQLHQHDTNTGQRLLDYFTLHCYPQEQHVSGDYVDTATELLRNQSTRQLWDTNYVDPSWINSVIMLIPRMKSWVSSYYPETKIGVTEYNWGAESSMNGATAQADVLGIFGRESLDLATRWTTPDPSTPAYLAMKLYRNYDGQDSSFGDISVLAGGPNPDNVAVFAAQRGADAALTIVAVNKYLTGTTPLVVNVTNFSAAASAEVWQLNASNVIARLPALAVNNNTLQMVVPAQSVTLFVLPGNSVLDFTPGKLRSDGQFEFWVNGQPGESFQLQSSLDLVHWAVVSTNKFVGASFHFLMPGGMAGTFYRAAIPN